MGVGPRVKGYASCKHSSGLVSALPSGNLSFFPFFSVEIFSHLVLASKDKQKNRNTAGTAAEGQPKCRNPVASRFP